MINGYDNMNKYNSLKNSRKNLKLNSNIPENLHNNQQTLSNLYLDKDLVKKFNLFSPKNQNNTNNNNVKNTFTEMEKFTNILNKEKSIEKIKNSTRNVKKKISTLENKNTFMNNTNKTNEFMKYLNKTFLNDPHNPESRRFNKNPENQINIDQNNNFSPTIMKKTLNMISLGNKSNRNNNNFGNFTQYRNNNNNQNEEINNNININNLNENFRNFINSAKNLNINYNIIQNNVNINNNVNYQNQTTRFLYNNSNYEKFNHTENAKFASKPAGIITSFGVNTNFGNVR